MDKTRFETDLAELLAGEGSPADRREKLERLRHSIEGDPELEGCRELLDLLALPDGERDLVEVPGQEYWSGFNRRLREKIEAAPPERSLGRWWPAAAAAVMLLALAVWMVARVPESPAAAVAGTSPEGAAVEQLPPSLAERLKNAPESELMAEIDFWVDPAAGWAEEPEAGVEAAWPGPAGPGAGLFPDTGDLGPEARQELLEWLKAQT